MTADPFRRRTATIANLAPWIGRILNDVPAQLGLYGPRPALDRGLRERIMMAVTDVNGCRYCAWIHGGWAELMSRGESARDDVALAYAREAAETSTLPPSDGARAALAAVFSAPEVRAIDAAIASIEIQNLAGNTVDCLIGRLTGARPLDPAILVQEAAVVGIAAPIGLPLLALGGVMRRLQETLPVPEVVLIDTPGEANMGALMLEQLISKYSDLPLLRAIAGGRLPFALGLDADGMNVTARLKPGMIEIENGLAADVGLILYGDIESFMVAAQNPGAMLGLINSGKLKTRLPGVRGEAEPRPSSTPR